MEAKYTPETCPDKDYHGNPFRYCGTCGWVEPANPIEAFTFTGTPQDLEEAVFQALGYASTCWDPKPSGVFLAEKARTAGDALVAYIKGHYEPREVEKIICPACAQQKAVPLNYPMHPDTTDHWQCQGCGHVFEAKEHS